MKDGLKNLMCLLIIVGTITCFAACTYNDTVDESAADELLKWKKLLDSGVITREEFDLKKKQLLGL